MLNAPTLSIVLPTKDSSRTVRTCLESLRLQNFTDFEIVFVDNFSKDDTREIAEEYSEKMPLSAFSFGPERHAQRKFGFERTTGRYLYFIDSDMYADPTLIGEAVSILEKNKNVGGLIVPEDNVGTKGYWSRVKAFERSFYDGDDSVEAARIFRREAYEKVGGYDETLIAGEDWDLSERVKAAGFSFLRTKARVGHDEGDVKLWPLLKKKFYYGSKIGGYVSKQENGGLLKKIYFFRPVFYKKWREFVKNPKLFPGFIIMMSLELAFWGAGLLVSKFRK